MLQFVFYIFFTVNAFAQDWTNVSFREDESFQYWVGISSEQASEKQALNEAYQEALNQAAKYNFGFKHKVVENTYSNKSEHQIHQETEWASEKILFKGIKPLRQKIKEKNGNFIAIREISYPKKEIIQELARLEKKDSSIEKTDEPPSKLFSYGNFKITTNLPGITVELLHKENPNPQKISAPAELTLPTGLYYLTATKEGHKTITREIIITGGINFTHLAMEKTLGALSLKIFPPDAKIKINNKPYEESIINLPAGSYKIEVSHKDFFSLSEEVELLDGEGVWREFILKPKKSAISIFSEPSDADVYINGEKVGKTPLVGAPFLTQDLNLDVVLIKKGYQLINKQVAFVPNKSMEPLNFKLKKIE